MKHKTKEQLHKEIDNYKDEISKLKNEIIGIKESHSDYNTLETALKRSEIRFRALFEGISDAVFVHPLKKEGFKYFIEVNDVACKRLGYSREELLKLTPKDISAPEDAKKQGDKRKRGELLKNQWMVFEATHITKQGKEIPVEISSRVFNFEGQHVLMSLAKDITEQKNIKKALQSEEVKTQSILKSMDNFVFVLDKDNRFISTFSPENKLYISQDKFIGKTHSEVMPPHIDILFNEALVKVKKRQTANFEYQLEMPEGFRDFKLSLSPLFDNNKYNGVVVVVDDITKKKKSEEEIKKLSTAVEQSANTIIITDINGNIEYTNPKFTELTGYSREEVIGLNPRVLNAGTEAKEYYKKMWQTISSGKIWKGEFHNKSKNGRLFWENVTITPIKNNDGIITNYLAVKEDITSHKEAKEALQESEKRFKQLSNLTFEGILINKKGIAIDINLSFARLFGYEREELIGKDLIEKLITEKYQSLAYNQLDNNISTPHEAEGIKKDGTLFPIEIEGRNFNINNDESIRVTAIRDITIRKKAFEELKQSEKDYRELFNNAANSIYIQDKNGSFIDVNRGVTEMYGYPKELFIGKTPEFLSAPGKNDLKNITGLIEKAYKGTPQQFEFWGLRKNGEIFPKIVQINRATYKGQDVVIAFATNITERYKSEQKIIDAKEHAEEEERKFRTFTSQASDGITVADLDGNYVFVNPAFCNMSGYTMEELLKMTVFDMKSSNQTHNSFNSTKSDKQGIPVRVTLQRKDGSEYITEITGKVITINNQEFVLGTIRDITERIFAEKLIKESEERYRLLATNTSDVIWTTDLNFNITYVNEAIFNFLGYTNEEFLGLNPKVFTTAEGLQKIGELAASIQSASNDNTRKYVRADIKQIKKDGKIIDVDLSANAIYNNKNQIIGYQGRSIDITNRKKLESDLINAKEHAEESDRLKSAFLANMSHEIRTPMNGILGFTSLLTQADITGEQLNKYAGIIEKSGDRMLNIINDLIDISKIEAKQMEVNLSNCNVKEQFEYLYNFFKNEATNKGLDFKYNKPAHNELIEVETDCEKVYAILTNLLKNSIKYTHKGSIEFGYSISGNNIEFYIADTGIGIPENRQEAIFERFIQADIEDTEVYEGAGLGLAITKAYVDMLGGNIWLKSTDGIGSTFYFTIPHISVKNEIVIEQKETVPTTSHTTIERKLKVLIAEDELYADTFLTIIVNEISSEILHATTGFETIDIFDNNSDIDLILMDIKMSGLNGYEVTEKIRKTNKDVIIIAQTAYALAGDREKAIAAGCNDYISKPIDKDELMKMINNLVSG